VRGVCRKYVYMHDRRDSYATKSFFDYEGLRKKYNFIEIKLPTYFFKEEKKIRQLISYRRGHERLILIGYAKKDKSKGKES